MVERDGRFARVIASFALSLAIFCAYCGVARAQTKLVKPANGSTLTIKKSGSYFMAANFFSALRNKPVITVSADYVTINMNGFTITGAGTSGAGTGNGINALGHTGVTIVNGSITAIPGAAIVLGTNSNVSSVNLISNGGDGIDCSANCLAVGNVITGNAGFGLNFADTSSGYESNILSSNGTSVAGGTNMGHNICNGALCPGGQ